MPEIRESETESEVAMEGREWRTEERVSL